ncbi:hypothetical protein EVG20_g4999 [Dentipellis fragilis]|uniref:Uncharacterized protein n=1 Tax=Dentipellis fragilis TaxID=205917 RepID=A0A4Y9YWP2_9AGAM|nr:hypothetical protein EVG20_g4999 [Dentipellis fragilis]
MQPHQYLQTNSFPDVDFYRSQSSSRPPSRAQVTNIYQQIPARVPNLGSGLTGYAGYAAAPPLYNSAAYSPGHPSTRSVTPEPWEAAMSEFHVSAYQHEMPTIHYESHFSVNSVHDSLRDTGPWIYNPDDERDTRVPGKRQASRSLQPAVRLHEARAEGEDNPIRTDDGNNSSKTRGKNKTRTAEQKARMAKSAANRRANDKDHLSIIKEKLPPLGYGQEYNNRTALAGAIDRFHRDEQEINALRGERDAIQERLNNVEARLANEERQRESLIAERDQLLVNWANTQADLELAKAEHAAKETVFAIQGTELANTKIELTNSRLELQSLGMRYGRACVTLQRSEVELRCYKDKYGPIHEL